MARWFGVCLLLGFISIWMKVHSGIYIPKRMYTFCTPSNIRSDEAIGTISLMEQRHFNCNTRDVDVNPPGQLSVQLGNLNIFIKVLSNTILKTLTETNFTLRIKCTLVSPIADYYEPLLNTTVTLQTGPSFPCPSTTLAVTSGRSENTANGGDNYQTACPRNEDLVYHIIENSDIGVIDVFYNHRLGSVYDPSRVLLESESGEYLFLDPSTGELQLKKSPDREVVEKIIHTINCTMTNSGQDDFRVVARNVTLLVQDVDDNPPYVGYTTKLQLSHANVTSSQIQFTIYDYDNPSITTDKTYRVYTNDSNLVNVSSKFSYIRRPRTLLNISRITTELRVLLDNLVESSTVDVIFEDLFYQPNDLQDARPSNKVVYRMFIPANLTKTKPATAPPPKQLFLDIAAANYSLVTQLADRANLTWTANITFDVTGVTNVNKGNFLAVTSTGDVYVNDSTKLSKYNDAPVVTTVTRKDVDGKTEEYRLLINVNNNSQTHFKDENCGLGCSIHNTSQRCKAACGLGAPDGRCKWRSSGSGTPSVSDKYSTCSPYLKTCPDGVCSELESLHNLNCPQDCNTGPVTGEGVVRGHHKKGISKAKGTCWCESHLTNGQLYCNCQPPKLIFNGTKARPPSSQQGHAETYVKHHDDTDVCSLICKVTIAAALIGVVVVMVGLALGCLLYRRRRQRQAGTLKHVGSLVSMNAVPSDYIVDDSLESRGHANRQASSPASNQGPWKNGISRQMMDDKWEFPRQYLTLEHVIGEGEFGQVVRAQAFMLRGQEGNTVVAVKMLKPDASGSEYQDLVSEIQLLKEVNHPNVIQLLGVCTQKGPLFAIVEYCELGSLRNFLRCSKFKNKGSWENRIQQGNDDDGMVTDNLTDPLCLTCRDLFSFAWQIAKGMDYLASLKIVHRDLAARNVLVTDGMKMKISDFGLSRDVYEADTYLKMSKGRIPVKWMAPESLYAQVYTTKSDIWSYGVVLWEIVTLGASPYPGIPPERLFPLLSTGYRMDRPEDCPEELYAIMQKCWKSEPENRPSFCALKDILDNLLQQNTEYLELSSGNNCLFNGTHSSSDDKPCENQSTAHSDIKPQYSNVCSVSHCQPNVYVETQADGCEEDTEEYPETSKLLGNSDSVDPWRGTAKQADIILDKAIIDGQKGSNRLLVHENLTYV